MVTIDPNNPIFSLISVLLGKVVTSDEYDVSNPIERLGRYNTEVILRPKLKGPFYVEHSFKYNRIDIGKYSPISIGRANAVKMSDLLPGINNIADFSSHVSINGVSKGVTFLVPPLRQSDIVDSLLPSIKQNSVYLLLNPKSYLFIGVALLDSVIVPIVVNPAIFISFEVTVKKEAIPPLSPVFLTFEVTLKRLASLLTSFSVTPSNSRINEPITLGFSAIRLKPNTQYIGYIYYEPNSVAREGSIFYKTSVLTTNATGDLTFSVNTTTPVTIDQTKLFLLIAEATVAVPNTVTPTNTYSETLSSQELVFNSPEPNTYFTSTLYGIVLQDALSVSISALQSGGLIKTPSDSMSAGQTSIDSGTLRETVVYVSFNVVEQSVLNAGVTAIDSGTLSETIVYKSSAIVETSTLQANTPSIESGTLKVVVSYLSYTTAETSKLNVSLSTITSGTLT